MRAEFWMVTRSSFDPIATAKSGTRFSGMSMTVKSPSPARSVVTSAGSSRPAGPAKTKDENTTLVSRDAPRRGKTDWAAVDALSDAEIEAAVRADPDAVPFDLDWSEAVLVVPPKKKAISIRVDEDVLEFFKTQGAGYQRRMNAVLRSYMDQTKSPKTRKQR
jgi:uncharacterized protein (DUF4415 family)